MMMVPRWIGKMIHRRKNRRCMHMHVQWRDNNITVGRYVALDEEGDHRWLLDGKNLGLVVGMLEPWEGMRKKGDIYRGVESASGPGGDL